jgi:hypothetical protein
MGSDRPPGSRSAPDVRRWDRTESPRQAVHDLALSLARNADVAAFARALAAVPRVRARTARIAAVFSFVNALVNVPAPFDGRIRDGVDLLLQLAGEQEGPAVILCALLQALGERAAVDYAPGMAFVRVEVHPEDLARLPPHARLIAAHGRHYLPLDPRQERSPLGFLPKPARDALVRLSRPA